MGHPSDSTSFGVVAELWTFAQDQAELQILRALGAPLVPQTSDLRAITWVGGNSWRSRPHNILDYIDGLKSGRFNESFLRFAFDPFSLTNTEFALTGIEFRLRLSPTSSMWESPYGHKGKTAGGERMRVFHESLERSLKWNTVRVCPTVLEASFTFLGRATKEHFYPCFAPVLAEALGAAPKIDFLGCADLSVEGEFGVFERLAPWPKAYPLLQSRFDDVHPVLIGPARLCEDLRNSVRGIGANASPDCWRAQEDVSVLWLPEDISKAVKGARATYSFLVEKSESTQSVRAGRGSQFGDFRFGPAQFHTFRRYRQLVTDGLLPSADAEHIYFSLIAPEYCQLIGIDPDEMLVTSGPTLFVEEIRSRINSVFSHLPHSMSVTKRIYLAHEQVYREKYGTAPDLFEPLWAYVSKTYFDKKNGRVG